MSPRALSLINSSPQEGGLPRIQYFSSVSVGLSLLPNGDMVWPGSRQKCIEGQQLWVSYSTPGCGEGEGSVG